MSTEPMLIALFGVTVVGALGFAVWQLFRARLAKQRNETSSLESRE